MNDKIVEGNEAKVSKWEGSSRWWTNVGVKTVESHCAVVWRRAMLPADGVDYGWDNARNIIAAAKIFITDYGEQLNKITGCERNKYSICVYIQMYNCEKIWVI